MNTQEGGSIQFDMNLGTFMGRTLFVVVVLVAVVRLSFGQEGGNLGDRSLPQASAAGYAPILHFNPGRDAANDIQAAIGEAQRTGKRVFLEVGGDWCLYCLQLAQIFRDNRHLLELREQSFIMVPIFYSSEQKNHDVLSRYPKLEGIPHIFILEKDGSLLHSQHVLDLRTQGAYDPAKIEEFLTKWAPRGNETTSDEASQRIR